MTTLHEDLKRQHDVKGSSDRAFGLTVGGILAAIALWWALSDDLGAAGAALGGAGLALLALGAIAPRVLGPLNRAWQQLGLFLGRIVSPVVLGLIYATTIVPIGLLMRLRGKDLLRLRREPELDTYWITKDPPGPAPQTITRQF